MTDKQIIIEDCPHLIGGYCQKYLDGVCENHKCDLKIIRELEQKLKAKEQECEGLKEQLEIAKQNYSYEAEKLEIYIQTLAEIKEIAEEKAKVNDWLAIDILQKINEVEDG